VGLLPSQIFAKPLELKYATMNPTTAWVNPNGYLPWAEKVKEVTNGRVTAKIYPAQTLGKAPEFFDLVKSGVAPEVPMYTLFKGIFTFLMADIIHVSLLLAVPQITQFLPKILGMM
jgi:TRAP-type C4-dicarboxylate transport system substrate-binding protein